MDRAPFARSTRCTSTISGHLMGSCGTATWRTGSVPKRASFHKCLANFALFQVLSPGQPQRVDVSYTFFKQQVEADNVAQISTRADTIQGTFRQAVAYQPDPAVAAKTVADFSTVIPAFADPGLETLLAAHGGVINARPLDQPSNPILTLLLSFGPTLLLIGGFLWLTRRAAGQMGGGVFGLGKSRARRYDETTVGDR